MNRKQESSSKKQQQGRPFFGGGWHPGVKNHQKNPVTIDTYDASKRIQKKNKISSREFHVWIQILYIGLPSISLGWPVTLQLQNYSHLPSCFFKGLFSLQGGYSCIFMKKNMDWYLVLVLPILKPKLGKNTDLYMSYYSSFTNLFTYAPVDTTIEWNHGL